jgi:UDP-glucose 4-epimerase
LLAWVATQLRSYRGSRALVTGGLGFIGSHLAERLVELGAEVTIVDSLVPEHGGNLFNIEAFANGLHVNRSDLRDRQSIRHLVRDKDFIFNLAGQVSHIDSMHERRTISS